MDVLDTRLIKATQVSGDDPRPTDLVMFRRGASGEEVGIPWSRVLELLGQAQMELTDVIWDGGEVGDEPDYLLDGGEIGDVDDIIVDSGESIEG